MPNQLFHPTAFSKRRSQSIRDGKMLGIVVRLCSIKLNCNNYWQYLFIRRSCSGRTGEKPRRYMHKYEKSKTSNSKHFS